MNVRGCKHKMMHEKSEAEQPMVLLCQNSTMNESGDDSCSETLGRVTKVLSCLEISYQ